jgi:hypothetical protein
MYVVLIWTVLCIDMQAGSIRWHPVREVILRQNLRFRLRYSLVLPEILIVSS